MLKSINRKLDEMGVEEARLVKAFHHNWEEFDSTLKRFHPHPSQSQRPRTLPNCCRRWLAISAHNPPTWQF
jgi:hypothetical protein